MDINMISPDAPIDGFRAQVALATPGLGVIRGTANDQVNLAGAAPTRILGVTDVGTNSAIGDATAIRRAMPGRRAYVQIGAAVAIDAYLTTNASGQFITATTGQKALARAEAVGAAAGDLLAATFLDGDLSAP